MSDGERKCYEFETCGNYVTGRALACSATCRRRHADRLRRDRESGRDARLVAGEEGREVVRDVLKEELRPLIRETLTEDVLQQARDLIEEGLPAAIQAAIEDLESEDETIRQRAYTLILKHTMGSEALLPRKEDEAQGNLYVTFAMPRPGDTAPPEHTIDGEVIDTKLCDSCHRDLPVAAFEQGSDRCTECFDSMRASATRLLGTKAVVQDGSTH